MLRGPLTADAQLLREHWVSSYSKALPSGVSPSNTASKPASPHRRYPLAHRKCIRTTNLLEQLFGAERQGRKVVANAFAELQVLNVRGADPRLRTLQIEGKTMRHRANQGLWFLAAIAVIALRGLVFGAPDAAAVPITVTAGNGLKFGKLVPHSASGGSIELNAPGSSVTCTFIDCLSGTEQFGTFDATGDPNAAVGITLPGSTTLNSGGNSMSVDSFTHDAGTPATFDGSGNLTFKVGAKLSVGANQAQGSYTGQYTVTVEYP